MKSGRTRRSVDAAVKNADTHRAPPGLRVTLGATTVTSSP
jgi:hypothetical protein